MEQEQQLWAANIMREHGVRIANSQKNVGKAKFAFNVFQRKMLPKMYRPPRVCIGKLES